MAKPHFLHPSSFIVHPSLRRGFTLTELLIVIAIMVVVAAFLIPAVRPALQDRKIRESARMVNVFFASAQARAIEKQRLVGVWLERNPNNNNECIQLYMAEMPLPYSGDTLGARMFVSVDANGYYAEPTDLAGGGASVGSLTTLVQPGDQIKFDFRGASYEIRAAVSGDPPLRVRFSPNNNRAPSTVVTGPGVPFQIFRQPKRSSATTFSLPTKTCINLYFSGGGYGGHGPPATVGGGPMAPLGSANPDLAPLLVCFGPSGRLDRAYARDPADIIAGTNPPLGRWKAVPASEALYLFVARNDRDGILADDQRNLEDTSNLWVTVAHRTGMTTTVDNVNTSAMPFPAPSSAANIAIRAAKVAEARRLAREKTGMGGR